MTPGRVSGPYDGSLKCKTPLKSLQSAVKAPASVTTRRKQLPRTPLRQTLAQSDQGDEGEEGDCFGRTPIQPIKARTPGPLITATPVVGGDGGSKKSSNVFQTIQVHLDEDEICDNLVTSGHEAKKAEEENTMPVKETEEDTVFVKKTPIHERLYRQRPAHMMMHAQKQAAEPLKRSSAPTSKPTPHFMQRTEAMKQRLQSMREARTATRDSFSIKPTNLKKRALTLPKPFSFAARPVRKPTGQTMNPPPPTFRARPVPHPPPFRPAPSARPPTQPRPVQLALDRRHRDRQRWELMQKQREEQVEKQKRLAQEARQKQEARDIRNLRQAQVHQPLPMPRFGPVEVVKRSERPLTVPHSPQLATNRRARLAK